MTKNRKLGVACGLLIAASACSNQPEASAVPSAATPAQVATPAAAPAPAPAPTAAPQAPRFRIVENVQTPKATTADGCTTLELDRRWHVLTYRRGPSPSCPHFEQSLDLLHEMLTAFSAMDDLSTVTSLGVDHDYASFYERLALASATAPTWDSRHGKPKRDENGGDTLNAFVVEVAHEPAKFFPEVVTLLRDLPLRPELHGVEKVMVSEAAQTPYATALGGAKIDPKAKLPFDCSLGFALVPK